MTDDALESLEPPLPRELQVEVTAACNLRCEMCLVRYRPPVNRVTGSMDMATFRRLVDENPNLERITLQGLGEPLLAPDLFPMIEHATARGIDVGFNTNATLLTRQKSERLVRSGLAWLHVSLDGAQAATYEAIRDGARFDKVVANLRGLADVKDALGSHRPEVRVVFVAMRRNVAELPDLVTLAADCGVERVWVQNLSHSFDDCDPAGDYGDIRRYAEDQALWGDDDDSPAGCTTRDDAFARAAGVAGEVGVALRLPRSTPTQRRVAAPQRPGCDWPWRSGYVTASGQLQPCCMVMGADRAVLGQVDGEGGFAAEWRNEAYQSFRRGLLDGDPPDVCRGCSMYRGVF